MSKKLYIYEYVSKITTSWHDGGGLVIVTAGDPSDAWRDENERIAAEHPSNRIHLDPKYIIQELPEPDRVIEVPDDTPDMVMTFPDAGCC